MHAKVAVGSVRFLYDGGLAQMVERALCMREATGSMPASYTKNYFHSIFPYFWEALAAKGRKMLPLPKTVDQAAPRIGQEQENAAPSQEGLRQVGPCQLQNIPSRPGIENQPAQPAEVNLNFEVSCKEHKETTSSRWLHSTSRVRWERSDN